MNIHLFQTQLSLIRGFGKLLYQEINNNPDYYYITELDHAIIKAIPSRHTYLCCLQSITRLRYSDLFYLINYNFFSAHSVCFPTQKNSYPFCYQLKNDLTTSIYNADFFTYLSKNLNYSVYKYDLKSSLQRLQLPVWFTGRNVSHCFRKTLASQLSLDGASKKVVASQLQQFDLNSQKCYIDPAVLNNFSNKP